MTSLLAGHLDPATLRAWLRGATAWGIHCTITGGDSTKVNTIVGPYLFGQGEDLTPITMAAQDLNGDNMADLIVSVKSEQLLYLNDGTTFRLATPEERAAIEQSLKAKAAQPRVDQRPAAQQGGAAPEVGR